MSDSKDPLLDIADVEVASSGDFVDPKSGALVVPIRVALGRMLHAYFAKAAADENLPSAEQALGAWVREALLNLAEQLVEQAVKNTGDPPGDVFAAMDSPGTLLAALALLEEQQGLIGCQTVNEDNPS